MKVFSFFMRNGTKIISIEQREVPQFCAQSGSLNATSRDVIFGVNHIQSYNARSSLSSQRNAFVFEIENLKCLKAFLHAKNGNSLKPGYFSLTYHYAIFRNLNSNYHFLFNALMIMST